MNNSQQKRLEKYTRLRIQTIDDGIIRSGPDFVRIGVCQKCNFDCVMCWHHSSFFENNRENRGKTELLDENIIFDTINEAEKMGTRGILFSGSGEPFLHPKMMDFLKVAKGKGFRVRVQTNLSLVSDPSLLAKLKVDVIAVNLCAATADTYVKIHPNQKKSGFKRTLAKMEELIACSDPEIEIRMTNIISRLNYNEICEMFKLGYDMNASLHLELADYSPVLKDKIGLDEIQKKEIIRQLDSLDEKYLLYKKTNLPDFREQLAHSGIGLVKFKSCLMGHLYAFVNEYGNVYFCNYGGNEYLMGNLYENTLSEIWNSRKYEELRDRLFKGVDVLPACQKCLNERGWNFKTRFFVDPDMAKSVLNDVLESIK